MWSATALVKGPRRLRVSPEAPSDFRIVLSLVDPQGSARHTLELAFLPHSTMLDPTNPDADRLTFWSARTRRFAGTFETISVAAALEARPDLRTCRQLKFI